jgi:hypothetical protein
MAMPMAERQAVDGRSSIGAYKQPFIGNNTPNEALCDNLLVDGGGGVSGSGVIITAGSHFIVQDDKK